ncbi:branched-chain amino acid aminotransferase [bacterium]|nr:branched-chain amino acid aminotransferase [bacterium]
MSNLINTLWNDENGFVVSAELVLITTIAVLGLVVGLSEVSHAINNELEDVASAFGSLNQSYSASGLRSCHKSSKAGSSFTDHADLCDSEYDIVTIGAQSEN